MNHETEQSIIPTDDGFSEKKSALKIENPLQNLTPGGLKPHKKKKKKEVTLFEEK